MSQNLSERYSVALTHYLAYPDEDVLNQAYELGRKALGDGLGVLDIAMVHHDALHSVISDQSRAKMPAPVIAKAAAFLAESLSPFEMSFRGYAEANARLTVVNDSLLQSQAAAEAAHRELEVGSTGSVKRCWRIMPIRWTRRGVGISTSCDRVPSRWAA
jgi:hypothetical protein